MNMVLDVMPVVFLHPINGRIDQMPVEMIGAYVPFASHLRLEEAARVACVRDEEAAVNLLESVKGQYSVLDVSEGCGYDALSVEPPSLR